MCIEGYVFNDDEEAYQIHPKKSEYVNVVDNCLHLWKPNGHELGELINLERGKHMRNLKAYDKAIADFAYRVKEELMQELPTNYATTRPYFGLKE